MVDVGEADGVGGSDSDGDVLQDFDMGSDDETVGSAARQGDKRQRKHVRDRKVLNWYHKFAGYDGKKLPSGGLAAPLTADIKKLFKDAKQKGLAVGCGNCLWTAEGDSIELDRSHLMHVLCPTAEKGKRNVVTEPE